MDSGSGGPILYSGNRELQDSLLKQANLPEPEVCALRRAFAALPPQGVRIDTLLVQGVPFVTPAKAVEIGPEREEDGALATVLFQRVYFGNADHFVIFDPR